LGTFALIITICLFIIGLVGTILPVLPGAILIYGGMFIYGFITNFKTLDFNFYLIEGVAFAFIFLVDYLATAVGSRRFGGSKYAAWGAAIGTILGLFFGPLGILVGPFVGAVSGELLRRTKIKQAIRIGFGTVRLGIQ
jgi:uncharacterized protein